MENKSLYLAEIMFTITALFPVIVQLFLNISAGNIANPVSLKWFALPAFYLIFLVIISVRNLDNYWLRFILYCNMFVFALIILYLSSIETIDSWDNLFEVIANIEFGVLNFLNFYIFPGAVLVFSVITESDSS